MYKVVTTTLTTDELGAAMADFYVREKQIRDDMGLENLLNVIERCGHTIEKILPGKEGEFVVIYKEKL